MSIDRELLGLAAKAACYRICHLESDTCAYVADDLTGAHFYWEPRDDDGDALRLAVKLRINIQFSGGRYSVSARNVFDICCEFEGEDTIRRAIVRAAAEIGKAKP